MKSNRPITKEEFLDRKNLKLIEEVNTAFKLKEEIAIATVFINIKRSENPKIFCKFQRKHIEGYRPKTYAISVLMSLIEMIDSGELIFKDVEDESK